LVEDGNSLLFSSSNNSFKTPIFKKKFLKLTGRLIPNFLMRC
jgi:hypothetical protein